MCHTVLHRKLHHYQHVKAHYNLKVWGEVSLSSRPRPCPRRLEVNCASAAAGILPLEDKGTHS
jgi:hypothetical protein